MDLIGDHVEQVDFILLKDALHYGNLHGLVGRGPVQGSGWTTVWARKDSVGIRHGCDEGKGPHEYMSEHMVRTWWH